MKAFLLPYGAGFVFAYLLIFLIPVPMAWRWHQTEGTFNKLGWVYDRVHKNNKPIDVAFVGTSHMWCALDDQRIETQLRSMGVQLNIANLSIPHHGRNMEHRVIDELIATGHRPKLVFMEFRETETREAHEFFHLTASPSQALCAFPLNHLRYWSDINHSARESIRWLVQQFQGEVQSTSSAIGTWSPHSGDGPAISAEKYQRYTSVKKRLNILPNSLNWLEYAFSRHHFAAECRTLNENKIKMVGFYLPSLAGLRTAEPVGYEKMPLPEMLKLPEQIQRSEAYWFDDVHLNTNGKILASDFMIHEIVRLLPPQKNADAIINN